MLQEKMNSENVAQHLGKSSKTNVWQKFPFQELYEADKPANFELAFR